MTDIQRCTFKHLRRYGEIYAEAFRGDPWNDDWSVEDATTHVRELLENKQSYGLECIRDGQVVGFILGTSMLFHYGRTFEINDLAVAPCRRHQGIATRLMETLLADMDAQDIKAVHLITSAYGVLPSFYQKFGFKRETEVMLMGR